jgi:hypothetical protein
MERNLGLICTLAVLWLISGCATQSHAPSSPASTQELAIKPGEILHVVTLRRERLSFKVIEIRADRFIGVTIEPEDQEHRPAGQRVEVPFEELALVRFTRFSFARVAAAVFLVGGAAAAVAAIPAAGLPAAAPLVVP